MNLEIVLWVVSFFIIWEGIYIFCMKKFLDDWVFGKIQSGLIASFFMFVQFAIASESFNLKINELNYFNLIYELIIILGLILFFYSNKKLAEYIQK